MSRYPQAETFRPFLTVRPFFEEENVGLLRSLLRHRRARRRARQLEHTHQAGDEMLAGRVQSLITGFGLTKAGSSIGGGANVQAPQVISVSAGPPVSLDIRILAGQMADDFAAHAPAFAYKLGVAEVRVVPLGPSLIRLKLLPN
jgi:hypothetical protein